MCIFCMCLRFIIYVWNRINAILNWCWWNLFRAGEMNSKKKHSKTQFSFWRVDSQLCWRDEHTEWTREIQIFISIVERLDKLKKRELRNIAIWKKDKKASAWAMATTTTHSKIPNVISHQPIYKWSEWNAEKMNSFKW